MSHFCCDIDDQTSLSAGLTPLNPFPPSEHGEEKRDGNALNHCKDDLPNDDVAAIHVHDDNFLDVKTKQFCWKFWPVLTDDATGYLLSRMGMGAVIASYFILSPALLDLSELAAGCTDDEIKCDHRIHGFNPDSLLTMTAVVSGLLSAFTLPVIGAIVDRTSYRRSIFAIGSIFIIAIQGIQAGTGLHTWFVMAILQCIKGFIYDVVSITALAYLPEIAVVVGETKMTSYTASFNSSFYITQVIFLTTITVVSFALNLGTVDLARLGQGLVVFVSGMLYFLSWKFFMHRDAKTEIDDMDSSFIIAGFKSNWMTLRRIYKYYSRTLGPYFIATSLSMTAVQAFTVVSITYFDGVLRIDGDEINVILLIVLIAIVPGSYLGSFVTRQTNPKISILFNIIIFIGVNFAAFSILYGEEQKVYAYIFAPIWGILVGWYYTTDSLVFSLILPEGQETEFTGFYQYSSRILSWVAPLVFTIMNEKGINLQYAGMHLNIYLFLSLFFYWYMDSWASVRSGANVYE